MTSVISRVGNGVRKVMRTLDDTDGFQPVVDIPSRDNQTSRYFNFSHVAEEHKSYLFGLVKSVRQGRQFSFEYLRNTALGLQKTVEQMSASVNSEFFVDFRGNASRTAARANTFDEIISAELKSKDFDKFLMKLTFPKKSTGVDDNNEPEYAVPYVALTQYGRGAPDKDRIYFFGSNVSDPVFQAVMSRYFKTGKFYRLGFGDSSD